MSTVADNSNILKAIGGLEEAIKNLVAQAEKLDDRVQENREIIATRIDGLQREIADLKSDIRLQDAAIKKMEPTVDRIDDSYERSQGVKHMGKLIWTVIIALASIAVTVANQLLTYFHH